MQNHFSPHARQRKPQQAPRPDGPQTRADGADGADAPAGEGADGGEGGVAATLQTSVHTFRLVDVLHCTHPKIVKARPAPARDAHVPRGRRDMCPADS